MFRKLPVLLLLAALTASAQTFTPKHIRVEAPEGMDQADILHTAGLEPVMNFMRWFERGFAA